MLSPLAALRCHRNLPALSLLISHLAAIAVLPVRFPTSRNATPRRLSEKDPAQAISARVSSSCCSRLARSCRNSKLGCLFTRPRLLGGAVLALLRGLRDIGQALLACLGLWLGSEHLDPTASLDVLVRQHDDEVDDRHEDDEVDDGRD